MANRLVLAVVLAVGLGVSAFAAAEAEKEAATVTVKGVLQEDKNGFFVTVDNVVYDIRINDESKADMHKFYTGLEGDLVKVTGKLHVEEVADKKPYMVLYSNEITRLKGEKVVVVQQPVVVEQPVVVQPRVVVREVYVEHPRSHIDVPFVHIRW
ncbi:MAG TPA: hypothetical protein VGP72_02125 [Planctomycetota bacterium]|jgi:hypothetical protein